MSASGEETLSDHELRLARLGGVDLVGQLLVRLAFSAEQAVGRLLAQLDGRLIVRVHIQQQAGNRGRQLAEQDELPDVLGIDARPAQCQVGSPADTQRVIGRPPFGVRTFITGRSMPGP
mgnify:CR=1 FL=1